MQEITAPHKVMDKIMEHVVAFRFKLKIEAIWWKLDFG